jgi:predicted DNA-binding protein
VDQPQKVSFVQSVRMNADLTRRLFKEAARRGVTPSLLIRELVAAGLDETEQSAMVNVADVHRAIDSLSRKSA